MGNENNNSNDVLLNTSKGKKNKSIIILTIVALVVILIGGGAYAIINNNPKVKVFNAIKATSKEIKSKEGFIEKIAMKDYSEILREKGVNQNIKFALKSSNIGEMENLNGIGMNLDYSIDINNKKLLYKIGVENKDTSIVSSQFYTDNNKLMIYVPELYNSWFTCDAENIDKQYNDSVLAQNGELANKEISFKVFGEDDNETLDKDFYKNIVEDYLKSNEETFKTIGENIKVEKLKESKDIEIGGISQKCTGYNLVVSGEDAKMFILKSYDYILQDENIKKIITEQVKYSYMQQIEDYNSPEEMVSDIYEDIKENRDSFENTINFDDINANVYIDKDGRAVSTECSTGINNNSGRKIQVKYCSDFKGKDNIGDIIDMSIEATKDEENAKIDFNKNTINKDGTIENEMNLNLSFDDDPISINTKSQYNTNNGDFDVLASLNGKNNGSMDINCDGNINFDKSSKKLAVDFDKIDFKNNTDQDGINISFDASYYIAPLQNSIEEPDGEKLEIFKLSEEEMTELAQEVQGNASKIAQEFMGM